MVIAQVWYPISTAPSDEIINVRFKDCAPYRAIFKTGYGWKPIEYNAPKNPTHWLPDNVDTILIGGIYHERHEDGTLRPLNDGYELFIEVRR